MAKTVALIAFALCIFAIASNVQGIYSDDPKYNPDPNGNYWIEGVRPVGCLTCVLNAPSKAKAGMKSGALEIKCRSRKNGAVTLTQAVWADEGGFWQTTVKEPNHDDICVVRLVESMDPECTVKVPGLGSARLNLSNWEHDDQGIRRTLYVPDLLAFMNKEHIPDCRMVRNKKGKLIPVLTDFS